MAASSATSELFRTGAALRAAVRAGLFDQLTTGQAPGFEQANLFVVPHGWADDLAGFCLANPAATPLLAVGRPGEPALPQLGADIDVRCDLPGYLIHAHGVSTRAADLMNSWTSDLVAVAVGCWFGAEAALETAGIRLRHREQGLQGPLFRTGRPAIPFGRLHGPLVISMRPFQTADVSRVAAITAGLPRAHGAPVHHGNPGALGIDPAAAPDWGEPLSCEAGETALFWGCGLTALAALLASGVPWFATHAPGRMLVTDRRNVPS